MPLADAPVSTGRTESQGLGITEPLDPALGTSGAPAVPRGIGNVAPVGRGGGGAVGVADELLELGTRIAEAISRGEFERARELTEEAIQAHAAGWLLPDGRH
jgi:hypothetical protein